MKNIIVGGFIAFLVLWAVITLSPPIDVELFNVAILTTIIDLVIKNLVISVIVAWVLQYIIAGVILFIFTKRYLKKWWI